LYFELSKINFQEADLAVADLTITAARSSVVDFSIPFLHTSLGILYKVNSIQNQFNSSKTIGILQEAEVNVLQIGTLLSPFSRWVWLSILVAFFVTSFSLRLVAWLSPIQKQEIIIASSDRGPSISEGLSLANSMWVLASSLVLRGCEIKIKVRNKELLLQQDSSF
jgi:hypothetical protein